MPKAAKKRPQTNKSEEDLNENTDGISPSKKAALDMNATYCVGESANNEKAKETAVKKILIKKGKGKEKSEDEDEAANGENGDQKAEGKEKKVPAKKKLAKNAGDVKNSPTKKPGKGKNVEDIADEQSETEQVEGVVEEEKGKKAKPAKGSSAKSAKGKKATKSTKDGESDENNDDDADKSDKGSDEGENGFSNGNAEAAESAVKPDGKKVRGRGAKGTAPKVPKGKTAGKKKELPVEKATRTNPRRQAKDIPDKKYVSED